MNSTLELLNVTDKYAHPNEKEAGSERLQLLKQYGVICGYGKIQEARHSTGCGN